MAAFDVIPLDATEPVKTRSLVSADEAARLAQLFKIFANETRLRLLHALVREDEVCVGDLANSLQMKPQAVSNQLQRLVDRGIVAPRRQGTSIYYHIVDPCVPVLLERGLCLTECCPEDVKQTTDCCDQANGTNCSEPADTPSEGRDSQARSKEATQKSSQSKRRNN